MDSVIHGAKKLCKRLKEGECVEGKPGSGRPRKTSIREERFLIREAVRDRKHSNVCPNVTDLSKSLKERTYTRISPRTVQRRLHERNYKKCLRTKKPYVTNVSPVNRRKRMKFARRIFTGQ